MLIEESEIMFLRRDRESKVVYLLCNQGVRGVVIEDVRGLVGDSGAIVKFVDSGDIDCSEWELDRECVGLWGVKDPSIVDRDSREYTLRSSCT
jgi:hypothetical protein